MQSDLEEQTSPRADNVSLEPDASSKASGKQKKAWTFGLIAAAVTALLVAAVVVVIVVDPFGWGKTNEETQSPKNSPKQSAKGNALIQGSFAIPKECSLNAIAPILSGLQMNDVSGFRVGQPANKYKTAGAHVAILHWDNAAKILSVALHQRNKNKKIGPAGGIVDGTGESLVEGTLRELKEEAMNRVNVTDDALHLIAAKQNTAKAGGLHLYGMYVLFVDDKSLVTGPDKHNEHEMVENTKLGLIKPTYHRFFEWTVAGNKGQLTDASANALIWNTAEHILWRVSQTVHCS